jgi:hypothetical protein
VVESHLSATESDAEAPVADVASPNIALFEVATPAISETIEPENTASDTTATETAATEVIEVTRPAATISEAAETAVTESGLSEAEPAAEDSGPLAAELGTDQAIKAQVNDELATGTDGATASS